MTRPEAAEADAILGHLGQVQRAREHAAADPAFGRRVQALKAWQQARLAAGYADLMAEPRYRAAVRFFLDELYGPGDYSLRDAQFAQVVPALVRLFPAEVVTTVRALAELHALSERLDGEMAAALDTDPIDEAAYGRAWRAVGQPEARERQVTLMLRVGTALERHTRSRLLRAGLHLMRGPAHAAGLGALQQMLETGFNAFAAMAPDAGRFLQTIAARERELARRWFADG